MGQRPVVNSNLALGRNVVVTDANGAWTLDNVSADKKYKITINVHHPDYVSDFEWGKMQADQKVTSEDLRRRKATIVMHYGITVSGKVADPKGKPVSGAVVAWGRSPYRETAGEDWTFRHEVYTDAAGVYRLPPMPVNGPVLFVTVMADGWSPQVQLIWYAKKNAPLDFQLKAGKRCGFVSWTNRVSRFPKYTFRFPPGAVANRSTTTSIRKSSTRKSQKADKNGIYEWTWAPGDKVAYSFFKTGYREKKLEIAVAGMEELVIPLSKAVSGGNDEKESEVEFADPEPLGSDAERLEQFFAFAGHLESVQKELHLTEQQKERLIAMQRRPEPLLTSPKERTAQIQRGYQQLQAILHPNQLDRAREIALQFEGAPAFIDADVIKALEITSDQRTKMQTTYHNAINAARKAYGRPDTANLSQEQQRALLEQANAIQKTLLDKFLKLLSREQQANYEKMIGKKIDSDRLMKEILDESLKKHVAPAEEAPPKEEIKADKKGAGTPKNAAAYAADKQNGSIQQYLPPSTAPDKIEAPAPTMSAAAGQKQIAGAASKRSAPKNQGIETERNAVEFGETVPLQNGMERLERYLYLFLEYRLDSVNEELRLTDQQKQQMFAPEPAWSDQVKRTEATQRIYRRLQAILLPKQIDRARRCSFRSRETRHSSMRTLSKDWR